MKKFWAIISILSMFVGVDFFAKSVEVSAVWARATTGTTGEVYMLIDNKGGDADSLMSITSDIADTAQIAETPVDDGQPHLPGAAPPPPDPKAALLVLGPKESKTLRPHGTHIVLQGLHRPLVEGENFPLKLNFLNKGIVEATVHIEHPGAQMYDGE